MLDRLVSMTSNRGALHAGRRRSRRQHIWGLAVLPVLLAAVASDPAQADGATTERVSVASDGTEGNGFSSDSAISADGRYVAFGSDSDNFVPGDTNGQPDVFARDRQTGVTQRLSVASDGTEANGGSSEPAISADGRYVTFGSGANNLVPGDTNGQPDIFVHDRDTGVTERVSVASGGTEANNFSVSPAISADGRFVAFYSAADNLVAGDTNGNNDVFVHDRETAQTVRVSVASDGTEANGGSSFCAISADGRFVAFQSNAGNLVPNDVGGQSDVFIHDRTTGTTEMVSLASDGTQGNLASSNPAISSDGRHVAFRSFANNLVPGDTNGSIDIFVHDRDTGATERVSVASDGTESSSHSNELAISPDGRYAAFSSNGSNLVPGDTNGVRDVFVRDRETGVTERVSVASDGTEGNQHSFSPAISAGGLHIAFHGGADSLVPEDTNGQSDVFVHDHPELLAAPYPLDFGLVLVGETHGPLSVTITNTRLPQITVTEISAPQAPFAVDGGTCDPVPFTLALGDSCELAFRFSPTSSGAFEDVLTLASDAPSSPHTLALQGVGVEEALSITPAVLDFGAVLPGETAGPLSVTVLNNHDAAIEITAVGDPTAPFATAGGTCGTVPFSLAPFASCTLDYGFSPAHSGTFDDFIEVTSDAPSGPDGFTLQGEALSRALSIAPPVLAFGNVPLGETGGPQTLTVTNVGALDVTLAGVSDPGAPFELVENTCGGVLPVGASCGLSYQYTPTGPKGNQTVVTVASDAESNPHTVPLFGAGTLHGTELVSRASGADGAKGDFDAAGAVVSADGRFVAFSSQAGNLHPDDTGNNPNEFDVFVRDVLSKETFLVSRASGIDGEEGDLGSLGASISADGRFVAFSSAASNLHPDDGDPIEDVFVRDMLTHETILVSRAAGADGVKGDGSSGVGPSAFSADGRYIVFGSVATNLHPDNPNGIGAVYVRDLQTHELFLVSRADGVDGEIANTGAGGASISADGRTVAFESRATNLHPDDGDDRLDIFVRDLQTHETTLVSRASGADGAKSNVHSAAPSISANGLRVAFASQSNNLHPDDPFCPPCDWDIFVRDLQTHETILASRASGADGVKGNGNSETPSIDANGRFVAFRSTSSNLHPDASDGFALHIFVRDLLTHEIFLASRASGADGDTGNESSSHPSISGDGRYVAFHSSASNLHPDDPEFDFWVDVYLRDVLGAPREPRLVFEPASLDFGGVTVGDTGPTRTATLANVAFGDADVTGLSLEGLPASGFALDVSDCGTTLPTGATCEVGVTFTPTALGAAAATLRATAIEETSAVLNLSGTGLAPSSQIDVDPDSLASALPQGQSEVRQLTLSNVGAAPLDWEVTDGGALLGGIVRPTGTVTPVTTRPAPKAVGGLTPAAVAAGAETVASQPFPHPGAGDVTLTHSASPEIHSPHSSACGDAGSGTTAQNAFLRTFTLTDFGITGDFGVSSVTFGVETLTTNVAVTVNLYTLDGPFVYDNLTLIGTHTQELAPQDLTLVTVPVSGIAAAGSTLVAEIVAPDLVGVGTFLPGSNNLGQTAPSYLAAPSCDIDEPTDLADLSRPSMHLVMAVMGTPPTPECAMPGWLGVAPTSGSVAVGDSQLVDVTFDATGLLPGDYEANLCLASNDSTTPLLPVPLTLTVTESEVEEAYTPLALVVDPEIRVSDGNGIFEPGELIDVASRWRNDGNATQSLTGTASNFGGPPQATYTLAAEDADHGTVAPGETASCLDTGVCYLLGLDDPAVRPATHWEATFEETLDDSDSSGKTWVLHIGDSFVDVPRANPFYPAIETLLHHGVTGGCSASEYCPAGSNTRAQMAVFLLRAVEGGAYVPPACVEGQELFADVPFDHSFCAWIEELAGRGVTSGCGGGEYCPGSPVTRAQMAVFLLKTLEDASYKPPACTGLFDDVPCPSPFADWVEELARREITAGCSATAYCPAAPVSRAQMAVFVAKAFGLTLYGP